MKGFPRVLPTALAVLLAAGCAGASGTPSPSGPAFELEVLPAQLVGRAIGGQWVVFLVTVTGLPADGTVAISAEAGGEPAEVEPADLEPGTVGEVTVVPAPVTGERDLAITITATRGGVTRTAGRTIPVVEGEDFEAATAAAHLARFTGWLGAHRPELGITAATAWEGTPGSWVLVVTHYVFTSEDWELDMAWHVMTPPDDWIRINLRRRWSETAPSVAFEIPSAAGTAPPREIEPDPEVWR